MDKETFEDIIRKMIDHFLVLKISYVDMIDKKRDIRRFYTFD